MLAPVCFIDRQDAGRRLARALRHHVTDRPLIVLALPRGGVPVAAPVADALGAPLDLFIVRKLGVPGYEELALGAIASGGAQVLNTDVIGQLGITRHEIDRIVAHEQRELDRREIAYRGTRPFSDLAGETVVVVDDGAATGASMRVAVRALRQLGPRSIVVAVPVASQPALDLLETVADECVCIMAPEPFYGVGIWYRDFTQTTDVEVRALVDDARRRLGARRPVAAAIGT